MVFRLHNYSCNRKQYVKIGNVESSLKTITCGVPQGSTLGPLLFLLYIYLPRSSKELTFRIFADDTNMFYSSRDPEQLQSVINEELGKVLKFCAANMLSINFKKTNYMIITSPKTKTNIRITVCNIEQKSQIKYLGVFIDKHLKWDAQLQHINNKISQNHCIRCIFFANKRESPTPYFTLLEILKLENVFKLKIGTLVHKLQYRKKDIPPALYDLAQPASAVHHYNTRYASNQNLHRPSSRTNYGLARFSVAASQIWETIPMKIKCLEFNSFKKKNINSFYSKIRHVE